MLAYHPIEQQNATRYFAPHPPHPPHLQKPLYVYFILFRHPENDMAVFTSVAVELLPPKCSCVVVLKEKVQQ